MLEEASSAVNGSVPQGQKIFGTWYAEDSTSSQEQDPEYKPRWKMAMIYSKLNAGEFVTKGMDRKARLDPDWIQSGQYLKQPQAVTLIKTVKKRKTLKTEIICSADEEYEEDQVPEDFNLQAESPHCLNMQRLEDFQAYLHQIVLEFKRILKAGGTDIWDSYKKIIESFYWACRANKNMITEGADSKQVLQSIKDPKCKAWKLKLTRKKTVDPTSLIDELPIVPQTASQMVTMKPEDMMELIEEEISMRKPEKK